MQSIRYNDLEFTLSPRGGRWDLSYQRPGGAPALAGSGLFAGASEAEAGRRGLALIKTLFPVGVRSVGPDVNHPNRIGDLRLVGPDVTHPNFIYWDQDSASSPQA